MFNKFIIIGLFIVLCIIIIVCILILFNVKRKSKYSNHCKKILCLICLKKLVHTCEDTSEKKKHILNGRVVL